MNPKDSSLEEILAEFAAEIRKQPLPTMKSNIDRIYSEAEIALQNLIKEARADEANTILNQIEMAEARIGQDPFTWDYLKGKIGKRIKELSQ